MELDINTDNIHKESIEEGIFVKKSILDLLPLNYQDAYRTILQ